jgi:hypothetical protein
LERCVAVSMPMRPRFLTAPPPANSLAPNVLSSFSLSEQEDLLVSRGYKHVTSMGLVAEADPGVGRHVPRLRPEDRGRVPLRAPRQATPRGAA